MAQAKLYNSKGEESGVVDLNDKVFNIKVKKDLVHQVYTALCANMRSPLAHAKDRSDVRGGGKKPWKQKGTGRARHGSNRSPIWRGGGITFGPLKVRNYSQKINKKMNKKAVKMCLSDKLSEQKLFVFEKSDLDGKTKTFIEFASKLPGFGRKMLFVTVDKDENMLQGSANVTNVDVDTAMEINVVDLLHHQYVIVNKEAISILEKRLV